jgi:hypothetical protein
VGLRGEALAVLVAILTMALLPALPCEAAPAPTPAELDIMIISTSSAPFNDALQAYESVPEMAVRLDFTIKQGWYNTSVLRVRFIASMTPAIETKMDLRSPDNTFDTHLAAVKYMSDSDMVSNSYKVDLPDQPAYELLQKGSVSVIFTFRTAGIWRVYYLYEVSGVGFCAGAGEVVMVKVTGDPGDVASFTGWMSGFLAIPVVVQLALGWVRRLKRSRNRRRD